MTTYFDEQAYIDARIRAESQLGAAGIYRASDEHDACGVGFVASIDGHHCRAVVEAALDALKAVWHRGAVDADGMTGDGAGIHLSIPRAFFIKHIARTGHKDDGGRLAVGMIFLPRKDIGAQEVCRAIVEREILRFGHSIYGWRQVPVNTHALGEKAKATRPEIEQVMFSMPRDMEENIAERQLYIIRRRIEKAVLAELVTDFYICSLSARSIIYKGMFLAEQVTAFYPDVMDEQFISNFAIYHQRYSTNTFPTWRLAQPFRILAHNGEINTIRGNINWMACHEDRMDTSIFASSIDDIKPVIAKGSSDSAALDAVFELLLQNGRDLPMVKTMMIPEAIDVSGDSPLAKLYGYCNAVMEPWDGPAAIAAFFGDWVIGGMDRNGLRPMRYSLTKEGLLIAGSETGMVPIDEARIIEKGRLGPGQMIAVDLKGKTVLKDAEIKTMLANRQAWDRWTSRAQPMAHVLLQTSSAQTPSKDETLPDLQTRLRRHYMAGWTMEDMELILVPMMCDGIEAVGSMGDDTPLSVLSGHYRGLHHFFRQNFSQVTNPPIDSLRERHVMSLRTRLGNLGNILDESPEQCDHLVMDSPFVTNAEWHALKQHLGANSTSEGMSEIAREIDCSFPVDAGTDGLKLALDRIRTEAEQAVRGGCEHIMLHDKNCSATRVPLPMILATGAVHAHLAAQKLRTFTSLNVASGECLDVHHTAVLIGVGATTVNPYAAEWAIADRVAKNLAGTHSFTDALAQYRKAIENGLLKIMSKMGIAVIASYRGGYNFEVLGLSRALVAEFFPPMSSRISGLGLNGIQSRLMALHKAAYCDDVHTLPVGGFFRYRRSGERHAFDGQIIHALQHACNSGSYNHWKKYSAMVASQPPIHLRDLLDFDIKNQPIAIDNVESVTSLRKRLVSPGISLGALSPEAHETLSIAMNRIGAKSDSGEGGEDHERFRLRENGDNPSSAIKQIASGRFGVTAAYLNHCEELEIKIAQGAKPGEGGQLPGLKVNDLIASLRHATPGVTLISPPPHHDIYSIEDLAQLIYDLKQINPHARVCVKLVASTGIGTIAAGVAKAKADTILISGHGGGTGASPQSSIKYAGMPWEMGLSEVHQILSMNGLRDKIVLRTDGGLKTGRDIVIAAMLGADEFGIGTASLLAMGCIMVRQCHSNTCPVGVCTQRDDLRAKFEGTPDKVVQLFTHIAEEVRDSLARLGFSSLDQIIGRTDLLSQVSRGDAALDDLDLNPILVQMESIGHAGYKGYGEGKTRIEVADTLDAQMVKDAKTALTNGGMMQLNYNIQNTSRAIGTRLSSHIVRQFGMTGLRAGQITARLHGTAGQSLGAFAVQGLKLEVIGDANDYVGKGLSGGMITIRPITNAAFKPEENSIIGNTVLYGATSGLLLANGQAGERLCVRNSGAIAVVEGCGSNGCEYMTGGTAVILGATGTNFGAGMTGGMAFIYDEGGEFLEKVNRTTLHLARIETRHWHEHLANLIQLHARETRSPLAKRLLADWDNEVAKFWHIVPLELLTRLPHPLTDEEAIPKRA